MAALVWFSTANDLPGLVAKFGVLSEFDVATIKALVPKSYAAITDNDDVRTSLAKVLQPLVIRAVNKALREAESTKRASTLSLYFSRSKVLLLELDLAPDDVDLFNDSASEASLTVAKALKEQAHYTGPFEFD